MPSLLFVDDEPNVLAGLRRMLRGRRADWDMAFCESGAAALERLAAEPADVVVTDMRMPGMDGAELLQRVRTVCPEAVRVVLSGHSDRELTLRAVGPAHQYLSKPCEPDRLAGAIRSALDLRGRVRSESVRRTIGSLTALPALPEVYRELVEAMNNPAASIESAGRIVARDLGLTAKVLQLVNSSFFGMPVRVADAPHAVALLGLGVVRPLVLSSGVFGQFDARSLGGLSLPRLTGHSTRVAVRAKALAESESLVRTSDDASDVFLAALMHDVGRLVLAQAKPAAYAELCRTAARDPARAPEYEQSLYGTTHAEVGAYLMQLWGLPTTVIEAIAMHHTPIEWTGDPHAALTAVHAAEALTDQEASWDRGYLERVGLADGPQRWANPTADPAARLGARS